MAEAAWKLPTHHHLHLAFADFPVHRIGGRRPDPNADLAASGCGERNVRARFSISRSANVIVTILGPFLLNAALAQRNLRAGNDTGA
jgi:hypothetical protein